MVPEILVPKSEQVQVGLFFRGFLLRLSASARYSATVCQLMTQYEPIFVAGIVPCLQSLRRKLVLSPLRSAASASEIGRSSETGLLPNCPSR